MADFIGHITVKSTRSNTSYNSSVLDKSGLSVPKIQQIPEVDGVQKFVQVSGILRTDKSFAGIIYKGVGRDFDRARFQKFLIEGTSPRITEDGYNSDVAISQKIASDLHLKVKDSIVAIFSRVDQKPIYRKFEISGIYKTDIKMIDDMFVIGDINQARKILDMKATEAGGLEIFLKDVDDTNLVSPKIEKLIGLKNYAEKATEKFPQITDWIGIFDTNIALIISVMLVVVIINIIMVLLILIIERTNSIGLLKTLGATNGQIRSIFINYTLLIMVPGLIIGNVVGLGLLLLQKFLGIIKLNPENYYVSTVPVTLNPLYILAISLGILLISGIALVLPSYIISKISPVRSIKYN